MISSGHIYLFTGGEAVLLDQRRGGRLHQGRDPATLLQALLDAPHGHGQEELQVRLGIGLQRLKPVKSI